METHPGQSSEKQSSEQTPREKTSQTPFDLRADLGGLAHWFIPALAVVYSVGFLVIYTFAATYGIRDVQLLQAKCIYIGSLCVIGCTIIWVFGLWIAQMRAKSGEWKSRLSGILAFAPMMIVFYILILFTERSFFQAHSTLILLNFVAPVLYLFVTWFPKIGITFHSATAEVDIPIWQPIVAGTAILLGALTLFQDGLFGRITSIFAFWPPTGGAGFLILNALIITYILTTEKRLREFASDLQSFLRICVSSLAVIGILFYLAVLSFAYALFPYIPAERGGGDYEHLGHISIAFKHEDQNPLPADLRAKANSSASPLVLLDENSDLLFLADVTDAGGPADWRRPEGNKPKVFEVRRDTVAGLTYLQTNPPINLPASTDQRN